MKKIILSIIFIFIFAGNVFAADMDPDDVTVPAAILVETNTGKILFEKNSNTKMYPASLTKIMTSIIVLENCALDEKVTVSYNTISDIPDGYSTAGLLVGEELTVEQLLHLTLIESANDAARVLAEYVAGSIDSFSSMMNTKAYELGCTNTNFLNPDGQHNENHYSTAHDLYLIANYATQNETFKSIVSKALYVVYPTNKHSTERRSYNTNQLLDTSSDFYDKRVTGVKTGFTTPAGNCLVATACENNMNVLLVVLGGLVEEDNFSQRYTSASNLIDYAFENYSYRTLQEKGTYFKTIEIQNATEETKHLKLLAENEITVFVNKENLEMEFMPIVNLKNNLFAPIKAGDVVGTLTYNVLGVDYTTNLIAANDVTPSEITTFVFVLIVFLVAFYIVFLFVRRKGREK